MPRAHLGWGDGRGSPCKASAPAPAAKGSNTERLRRARSLRRREIAPYQELPRQMDQPTMKSVQSAATKDGLGGLERELHATFQASRLPARQKHEHALVAQITVSACPISKKKIN